MFRMGFRDGFVQPSSYFAVGRQHTSPKKFFGGIPREAQATRRPFPCSPALPATIRVPRSTGSGASWRRASWRRSSGRGIEEAESRVRSSTPPGAAQPSAVASHGVASYKRGGKRSPTGSSRAACSTASAVASVALKAAPSTSCRAAAGATDLGLVPNGSLVVGSAPISPLSVDRRKVSHRINELQKGRGRPHAGCSSAKMLVSSC